MSGLMRLLVLALVACNNDYSIVKIDENDSDI
jgi:hypothetical protein